MSESHALLSSFPDLTGMQGRRVATPSDHSRSKSQTQSSSAHAPNAENRLEMVVNGLQGGSQAWTKDQVVSLKDELTKTDITTFFTAEEADDTALLLLVFQHSL